MFTLKHLLGILWLVSSAYCSPGGESTTFRKQDDHGNYAFGYDINDGKGGNNFHKETGDEHGNKRGSYGILGPDGRMRIVHYIADEHGFRVDIKSNEVGLTEGKAPAAAVVNGKDGDENSDYSSTYGQRTSGYHPPSPLYLSSTSNHPSSSPSKPYYLSSPVKHDEDHSSANEYSGGYPPSHQTSYTPKPKYSNYALAAKSYYPKNVAYEPKHSSYHSYPKNMAYEPPSYSSSHSAPSYGSTSYGSSYEPTSYPSSVHKPLIKASYSPAYSPPSYSPSYAPSHSPSSAHDYNSVYESPVYGTRKSAYASDLYSKSAEPVHSYTKYTGYANKKHNEKIKYYNDPYEQPKIDTSIVQASESKKAADDEEIAKSYRTETSNNGIISAKSPKKLSSLISLTSYRNPYSIDTEYKSS